ncbi:MAG: N-acetylmuramoyl-L-alanine amidase [Planctomycetes bacterium]|nr:N-acetylmuramoyl-L-alanine amidase [Planctomycetota bacterium]MCB9935819.1 N-acetylmuramoyl-L-alanine amidase [Planctomycetota bacterium]
MYLKLALLAFVFCLGGLLAAQPAQPNIIWDPSPNYTAGRTTTIDSIVIHTTEGSYSGSVSWLKNPSAGASAHYVIKEDGTEIKQLVANSDRAWHATYYNNRSIGIECAGYAGQASTWTQGILPALYDLVAWLCYTYNVQVVHPAGQATSQTQQDFNSPGLVGHYQVQPWNRTDPGAYFDWNALVTEVNNRLGAGSNDRIVDNTDPGFSVLSGTWSTGTTAAGHYGSDYRFAGSSSSVTAECEWRPTLPEGGTYEVLLYYPQGSNRADNSPFTVYHANGSTLSSVNQQANGGGWYSLGNYAFFTGTSGYVRLANNANPSVVLADAVWFKQITPAPAPAAPTGLVATPVNSTDVSFSWNYSAWADGYYVDIAESAADLTGATGTFQNASVARTSSHTWTGLTPGQTYYWRVWAYNQAGGNHGYPSPTSFTMPSGTPPAAPTGLTATVLSDTSVRFQWTASTGVDGYWLDIAESAADLTTGAGSPSFQNVNLGAAVTSHDWTGLTPGTTYYWRVYAYNTAGGAHGYPTPTTVVTSGGGTSGTPFDSGGDGNDSGCSTDGGQSWLLVALLGALSAAFMIRWRLS